MKNVFKYVMAFMLMVTAAVAQVPRSRHVVVVALENADYSQVTSTSMPYVTSLIAKGNKATNFYATTHPSIGNYFSLTAGQIITNNDASQTTRTEDNIVRHLIHTGVTWKSYAESLPSIGWTGGDRYPYVLHHNPFAYFSDVRNSSSGKLNLVPFTRFAADVNNDVLPALSFIVPNQYHNGHDCPAGGSSCTRTVKLQEADKWVKANLASVLASPAFKSGGDGLLVIWFDEATSGDSANGGGKIFVGLYGPNVKVGTNGTFYNHYGLLKTIMKALGQTTFPAKAATATSMDASFRTSTSPSSCTIGNGITLCSPVAGGKYASPVHVEAHARSTAPIQYMQIYVDGVKFKDYTGGTTHIVDEVPMAAGTRRLTVQAKDRNGVFVKKSVYITAY